jgi:hypothetical protein
MVPLDFEESTGAYPAHEKGRFCTVSARGTGQPSSPRSGIVVAGSLVSFSTIGKLATSLAVKVTLGSGKDKRIDRSHYYTCEGKMKSKSQTLLSVPPEHNDNRRQDEISLIVPHPSLASASHRGIFRKWPLESANRTDYCM